MPNFFWKTYWKLSGWTFAGNPPPESLKKMVFIVGPHTSWKDITIGLAARNVLGLKHIKFMGKKELFVWPFGFFFRWLGAVPVDRFASHGVVQQMVNHFNEHDELIVGLMPEGTRKKVKKIRTGFYHIARNANVPIVMIGLDFANKQVIISNPFYTTDNQQKDFDTILSFFAPIKGYHPHNGMGHLKNVSIKQEDGVQQIPGYSTIRNFA